jgi:hypothetical protein
MDIVLGVSMAPETVRMVLVEGENADGVTVEADEFPVAGADGSATSAPAQVVAAILGTREGAAEVGYRLMSTGVTWTEPTEVSSLRDALDVRQLRGVMLVSPLLAAAALTQTVGTAMDYDYTALLFIEPQTATLATVDTADGSIVDLHRQQLQCARQSAEVAAELATMVGALDGLESRPDGVFIVGCGVDIVPIKRQLDALISVPLSAPEEPDIALARGAALASATAPLFTSSTAALAYAQDPGTGEVKPHALAPAYLDAAANAQVGGGAVAYSALTDDDSDGVSRPFLLTGTALGAIFLIGLVTLLISLSADLGPRLGQRNSPHAGVMPTKHMTPPSKADAPAEAPHRPAAPPAAAPQPAPAPAPAPAPPPQTFTAPTPVVHQLPQRAVTPAPVRRAPSRPAPAEVPAPAEEQAPPPAAPPPPPAAPPPAAPAPQLPPMVMYLHLPFVTIPIPINPPPPAPGP